MNVNGGHLAISGDQTRGVCMRTFICLSPSRCNGWQACGLFAQVNVQIEYMEGRCFLCNCKRSQLKKGVLMGRGQVEWIFSTAPISLVKSPLLSLPAFPLSRFNKLPQPNLLFKNLWKMYVKVKRVHCAEKGSSL